MTLPELYEQQQNEIEQFKSFCEKVWDNLQTEQREISTAFGGTDKLPDNLQKRFDEQKANYTKEWANGTGTRFQELQQHHEQQREALTGIKQAKPEQPQPANDSDKTKSDQLSEKQDQMQKIIKEQQAIRARQQQKKRGR